MLHNTLRIGLHINTRMCMEYIIRSHERDKGKKPFAGLLFYSFWVLGVVGQNCSSFPPFVFVYPPTIRALVRYLRQTPLSSSSSTVSLLLTTTTTTTTSISITRVNQINHFEFAKECDLQHSTPVRHRHTKTNLSFLLLFLLLSFLFP